MKKVLFVCYGLGIGGIEKCLVNFINVLPENEFEIDLLLMKPEYDMLNQIRRSIDLFDSYKYAFDTGDTILEIKKRGGIIKNPIKSIKYCIFKVLNRFWLAPWKIFKKIDKEYDVAIAYSHNDFSPYYVIDKVNAKRKAIWYHNGEYKRSEKMYKTDKKYYRRYDNIVAVSTDCAKVLKMYFPELERRIIVLRNFCDKKDIKDKSIVFIPDTYKRKVLNISTVGRLTIEKGADLVIEVCKLLRDDGVSFIWHWIGDGNQKERITNRIKNEGLAACFLLEGNQENPYPYINNSDIYVQPSYYEAYSTTITEAKVLCKPIVTTDVGGMRDQLTDKKNAYIVGISAEELFNAIKKLIEHKEIRESFSDNLKGEMYSLDYILNEYKDQIFDFE